MTVKYDTVISKLAIICTQLAYEQFDKGLTDPDYDGSIATLPSYDKLPKAYTQVLTLKDKEIDPVCLPSVHKALRILLDEKLEKTSVLIKDIIEHLCFIGEHALTNKIEQTTSFKKNLVYFGFIIQSEDKNFLAFRGTETPQEWVSDLLALQTEINDHIKGSDDYKGISVHLGIMLQYSAFMNLINQTLEKLGGKAQLYVTGHSLGGASRLPYFMSLVRLH